MPTTICERCHSANDYNATVCVSCGARLCPNCHLVIDSPNASVCPKCGKKDPTFRPGKYAGSVYVPPTVSATANPSLTYCSNCGSRIEPGVKRCPYCGRLGTIVTQAPQQGYGTMKPAYGDYHAAAGVEPSTQTQKVCQKCGMPFPPGSSQCPKHGKYGGGSRLTESTIKLEGDNLWARIEEKRAASAAAEAGGTQPHRGAPAEDIYPQAAQPDYYPPVEAEAQRICPSCGAQVPDRSKVCPNCGNNRLPQQKSKPIMKAEEYFKAHAPAEQPYEYYPPTPDYGAPQAYPSQAYPPQDQYYGQPAVQPYEATYPVSPPSFIEDLTQEKKQGKQRRGKTTEEARYREARRGERKSPLPILLALIGLGVVIVIAVVMILDQFKAPAVVVPPSGLNPGTTTPASTGTISISDIQFSGITQNSAVVTWKTDKKSNSIVIYCLEGGTQCENAKDDTLVTNHSVKLTGLTAGKTYHITVQSQIKSGADDLEFPEASMDAPELLILQSAPNDVTPPKISDIKVTNITATTTGASAEITWKTDEPATGQVSYGPSQSYGTLQPEEPDTTLAKFHDVELYGLPSNTTIHYKVISRDASGNETSSTNNTFVTPPPAGTNIGNMAPDFSLPSAADTSTNISLSSFRGKKVIINFWSLNCSYCISEMPAFQQFHVKYPDVPLLAICGPQNFSVNRYEVGTILTKYDFTVLLDDSGQVGQLYNVNAVPVTYFLDSNGIIRKIQDGAFSGLSQIEEMLNSY